MKPIAILEHSPEAPAGFLGDAISRAGLPSVTFRLHQRSPLPKLDAIGAIASLGGAMGAYDEDQYDFLAPEKDLLRTAVARHVPVLGICLGCQLLADALGGRAYPAEQLEVGFAPLEMIGSAATDPVLSTLAKPVLYFHGDTWDPPPGVQVLAQTARYPHAFRSGSAIGVQPHPEASASVVRTWVAGFGRSKLENAGIDPSAVLDRMEASDPENEARAAVMFGAWLDEVVAASINSG